MKRKRKRRRHGLFALVLLLFLLSSASWGIKKGASGAAPDVPTQGAPAAAPAAGPSPSLGGTEALESGHVHDWQPVYGTVHHEAVTEDVWVPDREAWLEPKEAARAKCGCRCGFTGTYEQVSAHIQPYKDAWRDDPSLENEAEMQKHSFDTSDLSIWIVHEAEGHWEEQVVREAYDGPGVVGLRCSVCGLERQTEP